MSLKRALSARESQQKNCLSIQVSALTVMTVGINVPIYRVEICSPWCNIQKQICHPSYGEITITADRDIGKPQVTEQKRGRCESRERACDSSPQTRNSSLLTGGGRLTPVLRAAGEGEDHGGENWKDVNKLLVRIQQLVPWQRLYMW